MPTRLTFGVSQAFGEALALKISTPGIRPVDAIEQLLAGTFAQNLRDSDSLTLVKQPSVRLHAMHYKDRCATLPKLAADGYATWYVELAFSTKRDDILEKVEIDATGFELEPLNYGPAGFVAHRLWSKKLKTQANHILRLNHVILPPSIFSDTLRALEAMPPLEQPYVANPRPGPRSNGFELGIPGFEVVSFDHIASGERHFCSCAQPAHDKMKTTVDSMHAGDNAWPRQVTRLLSNVAYREGVCHLCVARQSGAEAVGLLYGDDVQEFVPAYIDQLMLTHDLDKATARSEVQQTLGVSRWLREAEMYSIVKKLFHEQVVMREASPSWLGRQRLDVFIPALNLALEHQGEQHYRAVNAFGGDEALKRGLERDAVKRRLCEENGVHLVEIRFDEQLTVSRLRQKLRRYI